MGWEGGPRCKLCNNQIPASQIFPKIRSGEAKELTHKAIGQTCPPKLKRCRLCGGLIGRDRGPDYCPSGAGSGKHIPEEEKVV